MRMVCTMGQALARAMLAGWVSLAAWGAAWREMPGPRGEEKPDPNSPYALPYALVIFAVLLGLLVVLRVSNRRDREKPEEYESKDLSVED